MNTDSEFDRQHIWHPYTGMNRPDPVYTVTGARGVRLEVEGFGGRRHEQLVDCHPWLTIQCSTRR